MIVAVSALADTVTDAPPGLAVTTYFVHGAPPSEAGAVQATVAPPKPACAVTVRGALGATGCTAMTSLAAERDVGAAADVAARQADACARRRRSATGAEKPRFVPADG